MLRIGIYSSFIRSYQINTYVMTELSTLRRDFRSILGNSRFKTFIFEITLEASKEIDDEYFSVTSKSEFILLWFPELLPNDPELSDSTRAYYFDLNYEINAEFRQKVIFTIVTFQWRTQSKELLECQCFLQTTQSDPKQSGMKVRWSSLGVITRPSNL